MSAHKAQPRIGIVLTVLSAALLVGIRTVGAPCETGATTASSCYAAAQAVFGAGIVLLVLSAVRIFEQDEGERRGLSFAAGLLGVLVACLPGVLIGLCEDSAARCHMFMQPLCLALGIAIALVGLGDLAFRLAKLFRKDPLR